VALSCEKEALIAAIAEWPSSSSIRSLFAHTKKESRPWVSLIQTATVSPGILASQVICFNAFHYRSLWFSSFLAHLWVFAFACLSCGVWVCVCVCWGVLLCLESRLCVVCCSVSVLPTHENYNTRLAISDSKFFGHLCECLVSFCVCLSRRLCVLVWVPGGVTFCGILCLCWAYTQTNPLTKHIQNQLDFKTCRRVSSTYVDVLGLRFQNKYWLWLGGWEI